MAWGPPKKQWGLGQPTPDTGVRLSDQLKKDLISLPVYSTPVVPLQYLLHGDVLVGRSAQGAQGMKVCPLLPGEQYTRYNSLVNDVANPSIFVVQHSNMVYPAYLITYHR